MTTLDTRTAPWPALAANSTTWGGKTTPTERAVEDALTFGSIDYCEADAALRILHALTGRCHHELREMVAELVEASAEVAEAESARDGDVVGRFGAAVDAYHALLSALAQPRTYDAAVAEALAVSR